jgi:hypothetical protein
VPFLVLARGSAPSLAWAVCPSAASVRSASVPPGRLHRRARHAAFVFSSCLCGQGEGRLPRGPRKSPSCASARSVKLTSRLCRGGHRRKPIYAMGESVFGSLLPAASCHVPLPASACCSGRALFSPHPQPSCELVSSLVVRSQGASPPRRRPNPSLQRTAFGSR